MTLSSWVPGADDSLFPVQNLPYGIVSHAESGLEPEPAVAIGAWVLPLGRFASTGLLDLRAGHESDPPVDARALFDSASLNEFMAAGRPAWTAVRATITRLLTDQDLREVVEPFLLPLGGVELHLPFTVADYVDFYSSEHHATNIGRIFRPDGDPLTPNWKHLPIGYHGRAGTVVVSGTHVIRPCGQRKAPPDALPTFGPSIRLDIEAEVGFVVGPPSALGTPAPSAAIRDHVFGVVLVNDWSARDLQAWEYVPLGPFLGKSFQTSISSWVVPLDALEPAMVPPPPQDPAPLPYLAEAQWGLDLELEVRLNGEIVSRPPFAQMYWTPAQQLAHMTVNGAALRTGDLYASGTVSGPARDQRGSMIELSWNGTEPIVLDDGSTRAFLEDGDSVTITATAPGAEGKRIGFGEVTGRILPAHHEAAGGDRG
jgi:fumarylacetoacetase